MTQKDNILNELSELKSNLVTLNRQHIYSVPEGYFDGLAEDVLTRIKAEEAANMADELYHLSPLLSKLSREMPYHVPAGYFENLPQSIISSVSSSVSPKSAKEELEALSPLLSGLKKETPYKVPQGYFDQMTPAVEKTEVKSTAKVISIISQRWFRIAAAAVITGLIMLAGFLYFNTEKEPGGKALAKFNRDFKKMDDNQKKDLIDFFDAGMNGTETAKATTEKNTKEIKDLLQGVSEEELKDFEQQTEDIQDVLMTN